jgi:polysaccharide pyruvyl transferase WcaK-like protein
MGETFVSANSIRNERKEKPLTICFVGGGFSLGNLGVSAMTSGNLRSIVRCLPGTEILIADYGIGPEDSSFQMKIEDKDVTIRKIRFRFSKKLLLRNNIFLMLFIVMLSRAVPFSQVRRALFRYSRSLEKIADANLVCSMAGGDSFSDIYGFRRLFYVSMPVLLGLALNRPVVLLPQTYGPFSGRLSRILARFILRKASLIFSRDHDGLNVIKELTGSPGKHAYFAYDMGFALEALPPEQKLLRQIEEIRHRGPLVGLNVSGLLCMTDYNRRNMFGLKSSYTQLLNELIQDLIENKKQQVILIPHVLGGGGPEGESDDSACERILADVRERVGDRIHYLPGPFDQHSMKYLIGQCDFFLGSRMHACIGALSQFVPTVALAYSQKFIGVLNSIGVGELVVDLRYIDEKGVLAKVDEVFARRQTIRHELHKRMAPIHESVLSFFSREELSRLIG